VIGGLRRARQNAISPPTFLKITNYDTAPPDLDLIARWAPDLVILDEAQRIKNWNTRGARSVKRIASPLRHRADRHAAGEPLEELVSIVQFVDQHRLGPTFRCCTSTRCATSRQGRRLSGLDRIGQTLAPILIRRRRRPRCSTSCPSASTRISSCR
jgi:hypothetical protein